MNDVVKKKPLQVEAQGVKYPQIIVPSSQLNSLRKLLDSNSITYSGGDYAISLDGQPPRVVVYLLRGADPVKVQALLDSVD